MAITNEQKLIIDSCSDAGLKLRKCVELACHWAHGSVCSKTVKKALTLWKTSRVVMDWLMNFVKGGHHKTYKIPTAAPA